MSPGSRPDVARHYPAPPGDRRLDRIDQLAVGRLDRPILIIDTLLPVEYGGRDRAGSACRTDDVAPEGARARLELGCARFGVERVIATTYERNLASQRLLEQLGMKLVRRFRVTAEELADSDTHHDAAGEVWKGDDLEYALDRAGWTRAVAGPVRD